MKTQLIKRLERSSERRLDPKLLTANNIGAASSGEQPLNLKRPDRNVMLALHEKISACKATAADGRVEQRRGITVRFNLTLVSVEAQSAHFFGDSPGAALMFGAPDSFCTSAICVFTVDASGALGAIRR